MLTIPDTKLYHYAGIRLIYPTPESVHKLQIDLSRMID